MVLQVTDKIASQSLTVEEARDVVLAHVGHMPSEEIDIVESFGRVLAQDVASDMDLSPFDNSGMDGYAVRFEDFAEAKPSQASPLKLKVVGAIAAGEVYEKTLESGQALRIMTGAPVPEGADTVIRLEDCLVMGAAERNGENQAFGEADGLFKANLASEKATGLCEENPVSEAATVQPIEHENPVSEAATVQPIEHEIQVAMMPKYQANVRFKGEEARKGEVLLRTGDRITSPGVGLIASCGLVRVSVYARPRVAIISTGSELVSAGEVPGPGQIRNSNSYSIAAAITEAGGIPFIQPQIKDSPKALSQALQLAAREYDFVITSGGAADGDFDFISTVFAELGRVFFSKVSMKPGKSQVFALVNGTPVFGLPGNPGAASVGFEILIRPALRKMQGLATFDRPVTKAILLQSMKKNSDKRRVYLRAQLTRRETGEYCVIPDGNQSSAVLGALYRSNCLAILPEGSGPHFPGEIIDCLRLDMEEGTI